MAHLQKKGEVYYLIDKSFGKSKWIKLGPIKFVEAKTVLAKYQTDKTYLRLGIQSDSTILFSELCKLYIDYAHQMKALGSVYREQGHLKNFCKTIGRIQMKDLKVEDLESLYKNRGYKPHTIRLKIIVLKALYNFAVQREYLKENIALKLKQPTIPTLPPKHVDPQLIGKVFKVMVPAVRMKFMILYYTGMRPSEMIRLQVQDIDLEKRTILVRYSKTNRFRLIPIHNNLYPILCKLTHNKDKEDFLFPAREGTQAKHQVYIQHSLRRACKKAKVEGVTPYVFRHQFATMVYDKTKDLRAVQQLLGHTDIRTTTRYATALNDQLINAVQALE